MATLACTHCSRRIFLRPRQLTPASGLCVPCGYQAVKQQSADLAWQRFRERLLLGPIEMPERAPLLPAVDLRHL
jgi:DNA-directed RNA polymerase subunit RPC12/RpoP